MTIFDVEELWTHGGSLRIYARPTGRHEPPRSASACSPCASARRRRATDDRDLPALRGAGARDQAQAARAADRGEAAGKRIAGYGAPGKGNTLLNYCGIRTDFLDFTVDRNPYKQGKFLPGHAHPDLTRPRRSTRSSPTTSSSCPGTSRTRSWRSSPTRESWGGRFIVPIPEATVVVDAGGAPRPGAGAPLAHPVSGRALRRHRDRLRRHRAAAAGGAPGLARSTGSCSRRRRSASRGARERGRVPGGRRARARSSIKPSGTSYFPSTVASEIKDFFESSSKDARTRI